MTQMVAAGFAWYERLTGPRGCELLLSAVIGFGALLSPRDTRHLAEYALGWLLMSILTGSALHIGTITRSECRDLRFMWLSIYGKLPRWVLWIFWIVVIAVLLKPIFGLPVLVSAWLSFLRGYKFPRCCPGCRIVLAADLFVRIMAGLLPVIV